MGLSQILLYSFIGLYMLQWWVENCKRLEASVQWERFSTVLCLFFLQWRSQVWGEVERWGGTGPCPPQTGKPWDQTIFCPPIRGTYEFFSRVYKKIMFEIYSLLVLLLLKVHGWRFDKPWLCVMRNFCQMCAGCCGYSRFFRCQWLKLDQCSLRSKEHWIIGA